VAGVLAKWVNVCSALDLAIEPLQVLAQHLRALAVLPADDAARLLEVVSAQAASEAQKRTKTNKSAQEKEDTVSEWTNAWKPNAQTTTKKDQRSAAAEKSTASKTAGKQKTTPPGGSGSKAQPPPPQMAENTKLLYEFFAARPRDLAAALTARHWAIFGPIPLLKLVSTYSVTRSRVYIITLITIILAGYYHYYY
jgi:hypothetical protein